MNINLNNVEDYDITYSLIALLSCALKSRSITSTAFFCQKSRNL